MVLTVLRKNVQNVQNVCPALRVPRMRERKVKNGKTGYVQRLSKVSEWLAPANAGRVNAVQNEEIEF